jgi:hypothetical protein
VNRWSKRGTEEEKRVRVDEQEEVISTEGKQGSE